MVGRSIVNFFFERGFSGSEINKITLNRIKVRKWFNGQMEQGKEE